MGNTYLKYYQIKSASKHLSVLRKLKFTVNKEILSKLYIVFIRPILEYASEVWDGCNIADIDKLEKFQLEAARIVTGLPLFASVQSLYNETGWEKLKDRRKQKKLLLLYKMNHGLVPSYLNEILPNRVNDVSRYNLRNG